MALVVAIIVNYRTPRLTIDCARSAVASRDSEVRVLVVDNASGDGSVEVLRAELPYAEVVALDQNTGYAGGNNVGLRRATEMGAAYALILNSDTILSPNCIARLTASLDGDLSAAMASPQILYAERPDLLWFGGGRFTLWTGRPVHVGRKESVSASLPAMDISFATGCAFMVRVSVLSEIGMLDESFFAYAEDVDWSIRIRRKGYAIRYVPDATLWHLEGVSFRGSAGQSFRVYLSGRNILRVMRKHGRWYHWPTFTAVFLVDFAARHVALALRDRDVAVARAVFRGIRDGIRGSLKVWPSDSGEPAAM